MLANVVDGERFRPGDPRGDALLHVGGSDPRKGLSILLEALAGMDEPPPVRSAGPGDLPTGPGILPLGVLTPDGLAAAYREAGVVCFPSLAEGAPMAVLEAMASGCAIVASEVGGLAEMVGGTAVLVPPGDVVALRAAIAGLLQDAALRAELGECARARALARNGLAGQVDRLVSLWSDVAISRARSRRNLTSSRR